MLVGESASGYDQIGQSEPQESTALGWRLPFLGPRTFLSLDETYYANLLRTPTLPHLRQSVHSKPFYQALSPEP